MTDSLEWIAVVSLVVAFVSFVVVAGDIALGRRQHMWIMNLVWPLTMLYAGPIGLWAYYSFGRRKAHGAGHAMTDARGSMKPKSPGWRAVATGTLHCGSGCTLGDIVGESLVGAAGWTLAGKAMWAAWIVDFLFAYFFGIAFQYFAIKPMRQLRPAQALIAAVKADTLSLAAWQIGMYGWMAIATFAIFERELDKSGPLFWFMMQIAMLCGFVTSVPANWWLIRAGIKERM
ncbi:MAG: DUF4396 domain-containing protein [Phycisphaeraceae bacterium]|nr:DUF4396 domain-containing protein [Phycisphaeraceae bacterium]